MSDTSNVASVHMVTFDPQPGELVITVDGMRYRRKFTKVQLLEIASWFTDAANKTEGKLT